MLDTALAAGYNITMPSEVIIPAFGNKMVDTGITVTRIKTRT